MKRILGISAFYHDAAAALTVGGEVIAAAQEERFTRIKHTADFPVHAIQYCLDEAGLTLDELDAVVFYDKPMLKFERLLETYYRNAPRGLSSFVKAIPVWVGEKLFFRKQLRDGLARVGPYKRRRLKMLFPSHHLSHAASAFFASPYSSAAILTIDGVGEWATASIGRGTGHDLTLLREMHFPDSVGLLYSAFTYYLGFKVNSGEYKLMGLAPYGNPQAEETQRFASLIRDQVVTIYEDGSIRLNRSLFDFETGLRMVHDRKFKRIFGVARRGADDSLEQVHCNLALAIQQVTEEIVLKMAQTARALTGASVLCLAGGVALNCVANGKLQRAGIFDHIYVQPAAGDAGGALGAALAVSRMYFGEDPAPPEVGYDRMKGAYLGPSYSTKEIHRAMLRLKAVAEPRQSLDGLLDRVAALLDEGAVVGWFQGRMEYGPRALGNRSILGDPRDKEMQKKLNVKIKYRESFRPFAPSVRASDATTYFDLGTDRSPYMLLVADVKSAYRKALPADFFDRDLMGRLYVERSELPAITHLDFSARVQTVHEETNPRFSALLDAFAARTGVGMLINTSFNVRGEPIVCTPEDAYRCFMATEMDVLVIDDWLFLKTEQPGAEDRSAWKQAFAAD